MREVGPAEVAHSDHICYCDLELDTNLSGDSLSQPTSQSASESESPASKSVCLFGHLNSNTQRNFLETLALTLSIHVSIAPEHTHTHILTLIEHSYICWSSVLYYWSIGMSGRG